MTSRTGIDGRMIAVIAFAIAFGWLEAVVVVYIRGLLGLPHGAAVPPATEVAARFETIPWLLPTEQSREAATLVILGALGWLAASTARRRWGAFLMAFGIWDITYYLALYALVRWPPSLATMDLLFLIPPGPWWYQPVWVPVAISCLLIATGLWLYRSAAHRPGAAPDRRGARLSTAG